MNSYTGRPIDRQQLAASPALSPEIMESYRSVGDTGFYYPLPWSPAALYAAICATCSKAFTFVRLPIEFDRWPLLQCRRCRREECRALDSFAQFLDANQRWIILAIAREEIEQKAAELKAAGSVLSPDDKNRLFKARAGAMLDVLRAKYARDTEVLKRSSWVLERLQ